MLQYAASSPSKSRRLNHGKSSSNQDGRVSRGSSKFFMAFLCQVPDAIIRSRADGSSKAYSGTFPIRPCRGCRVCRWVTCSLLGQVKNGQICVVSCHVLAVILIFAGGRVLHCAPRTNNYSHCAACAEVSESLSEQQPTSRRSRISFTSL